MDAFADWLTPYLSGGSLLALPLVALGGLITAFNPCCLPMYPAVFGFIGRACCSSTADATLEETHQSVQSKQAEKCHQAESKPLTSITLLFVLGMAAATSVMGILTAALGWVFGRFDSTFVLLLAMVPLLMGLNLLELLPMRIPVWFSNSWHSNNWHSDRLHAVVNAKLTSRVTAFGAGFLFSMVIAPCATPILLGILTLVAMQDDLVYAGVLMFVYGFGAGLPLLLVGFGFSRSQNLLNTPGHQKWLRRVSGLLLIGVSLYIIWVA